MSLDIAQIRALCFDVDGTLSDTDNHLVSRLTRGLNLIPFFFKNGDPQPFARRIVMATESPGNFLQGIPDSLGLDSILAALSDFIYQLGLGTHFKEIQAIPGAIESLHRLQSHYPISIVSNRGARSTQIFLDKFDLSDSVRCVATAQTCEHSKPHPDPILWAAGELGVPPESCLMIGDTTVDIRAGRAAGAQTVGVLCGFGEEEELRRTGADLILPSTSDLPNILLDGISQ
ncbi:MAG: HAD family hydrolase [Anaerolineales bacterium]|nr:HAD family hydrolase [Anaerolineales bacterium]MCK4978086.1 HAD family hydrolase [Anaerolineales bacterium]